MGSECNDDKCKWLRRLQLEAAAKFNNLTMAALATFNGLDDGITGKTKWFQRWQHTQNSIDLTKTTNYGESGDGKCGWLQPQRH